MAGAQPAIFSHVRGNAVTDMTRRAVAGGLALAVLSAGSRALGAASGGQWPGYANTLVVDALGGVGGSDPSAAPGAPLNAQDLADVRASGMSLCHMTVNQVGNVPDAFEQTLAAIALGERELAAHPDVFLKVLSGTDIARAKETKRLGIAYGFQDTWPLGPNLDRLDMFHGLGVRVIQLTYNKRNLVGDGCLEPSNTGLSDFGRKLVEALNARRILVDLAHAGQRTIAEGIAASRLPMAISHTGCRDLVNFPRNTFDAELRALAQKGGVAGVYFMPFLRASGQPHAEDVLRHVEHMVDVCGEDHVGIGTDGGTSAVVVNDAYRKAHREFVKARREAGIMAPGEDENVFNYVPEYNGPRKFERLAFDLSKRGYPDGRIEKILGGNFARLFAEVWG